MTASSLRSIHDKVQRHLYGRFALLALTCLTLFALVGWHVYNRHPELRTGTDLAEALQWPLSAFPPLTDVERDLVRQEFQLDEPLMASTLLLWKEVPGAGPLSPSDSEARTRIEQAAATLLRIGEPGSDAPEGALESALRDLNRANLAKAGLWWVLYNRGIVFHRQGNDRAAARELTAALKALRLNQAPASCEQYEAAVHTYYALGQALARSSQGEPEDIALRQRKEAIARFRSAVQTVKTLWDECRQNYPDATTHLAFFPLQPTGLSTAHLVNDLLTAYLAAPQYHDCPGEKPTQEPARCNRPETIPDKAPCSYRDRAFCRSFHRAAAPFGQPFDQRFHRFYRGDDAAWREEYRLWALSNAVDRVAENGGGIDDPYLLYNFGSLLLQIGEFQGAADNLRQAYDAASGSPSLSNEELRRISRLTAVGNVLAGRSPGVGAGGGEPSSIRVLYRRLYADDDTPPVKEFPPVGSAFEPNAEALLDNWLFLQLWRKLLQDGDFERFLREFDRLQAEKKDEFFQRWRREVLTRLGNHALERARRWETEQGLPQRAREIRYFLSDSGHFPWEIEKQARGNLLGWLAWGWRQAWPWLAGLILLITPMMSFLRARRLIQAHRDTFFSAYRQGRLGGFDNAYPRNDP